MTAPVPAAALAKLVRSGARGCSDAELLELVVGARRAASSVAALPSLQHRVAEAGGLAGLAASCVEEVTLALGVAPRRAAALVAALELGRRAAGAWPDGRWRVRTPGDLAVRLMPEMGRLEREELRVVVLDTKNGVLYAGTLYAGNLAGAPVRVGEVFREAVRRNAAALIVVHNHPSGDPAPSGEDVRITREMAGAGRLLDIELLDHLIVGHDRWVSLRSLGILGP